MKRFLFFFICVIPVLHITAQNTYKFKATAYSVIILENGVQKQSKWQDANLTIIYETANKTYKTFSANGNLRDVFNITGYFTKDGLDGISECLGVHTIDNKGENCDISTCYQKESTQILFQYSSYTIVYDVVSIE